ncbi:hypothetical protein AGABI1DRAFT_86579 [Agaricus bisporus var. burnettii JB137-S8]|uniref:Glutamine amidotransferase domain-containing protein n=1 Tax=Agaricus bisporus var. burnettii (strain JB137-S8 / ATCC MYA-4627 / FGSC 10392) TaxID=597362 RepID=K5VT91_AGABU|nr:uncharacterized protein AGABI1DRAFT_86579 [Agaricus bisporus var. burnettii JB137-S8]EKM77659.1 hypothetical protein AGABI1DRAFT_86579 [Agaricus bisporus var. burnettii JB137-S8]
MAPPATTRVALLICGSLTGPVRDTNGDYYDVYNRYWKNTVPPTANRRLVVDGYNVKEMKYPDEERISGYDMMMITGSAADAHDNAEWITRLIEFVQHLTRDYPKVKLFGVCFGHQIIARAIGGICARNNAWEVGPTTVKLTDIGRAVFDVDELDIQEMHRDHVPLDSISESLSSGEVHLLGSTDLSGCQGLVKFSSSATKPEEEGSLHPKDIQIITLQGHPEFTEPILTGIVRQRSASGAVPPDIVADYFGGKGDTGDGAPLDFNDTGKRWKKTNGVDVVGRVIWRMLGVEC